MCVFVCVFDGCGYTICMCLMGVGPLGLGQRSSGIRSGQELREFSAFSGTLGLAYLALSRYLTRAHTNIWLGVLCVQWHPRPCLSSALQVFDSRPRAHTNIWLATRTIICLAPPRSRMLSYLLCLALSCLCPCLSWCSAIFAGWFSTAVKTAVEVSHSHIICVHTALHTNSHNTKCKKKMSTYHPIYLYIHLLNTRSQLIAPPTLSTHLPTNHTYTTIWTFLIHTPNTSSNPPYPLHTPSPLLGDQICLHTRSHAAFVPSSRYNAVITQNVYILHYASLKSLSLFIIIITSFMPTITIILTLII